MTEKSSITVGYYWTKLDIVGHLEKEKLFPVERKEEENILFACIICELL